MTNLAAMSDAAILQVLGNRVKQERLNQNLTQETLAKNSGVSIIVVKRVEDGAGCLLRNLVRLLRSLNKLDNLDLFLPEPGMSPIELARLAGRERKEATGSRGRPRKES